MTDVLLDTCIVSKWYAKQKGVSDRLNLLPQGALLFVSVVTLGEIECGHASLSSLPTEQAEFRKWMRETLWPSKLEITESTAIEYARLRRECFTRFDKKHKFLECREDNLGQKLGIDENDLWLAAQAIERNVSLITLDKMHRIREVVEALHGSGRVTTWPDD